jgi:hypothetical protein
MTQEITDDDALYLRKWSQTMRYQADADRFRRIADRLDPATVAVPVEVIEQIVKELSDLSDVDFDWSADCGNQLPYDEWVAHKAQQALSMLQPYTKGER